MINYNEPPYIDKEELDKVLEKFIDIGHINPITKEDLEIYLSSEAMIRMIEKLPLEQKEIRNNV